MCYHDYPYGIFNTENIQQNATYLPNNIHDIEQQKYVLKMVKAISDYCEASRNITPDYQQLALNACFAEILAQMSKGN